MKIFNILHIKISRHENVRIVYDAGFLLKRVSVSERHAGQVQRRAEICTCCVGRTSTVCGSTVVAACRQHCIGCLSALRDSAVSAASAALPCWLHGAAPCRPHIAQNRQCLGTLRVDCPMIGHGRYDHTQSFDLIFYIPLWEKFLAKTL